MKYAVVLFDGMADYPCPALGGKTPMMLAKKPNLDYIASHGTAGLVKTVPDECKPGSDVANLGVLGYDTRICYTGRSPLEAVSIGVKLRDSDVTFRCNLVTLSDEEKFEEKTMVDYSAGDISSAEAAEIIRSVNERFGNDRYEFYSGVSYRHCLVWHHGNLDLGNLTPPHDISDKVIGPYLSDSKNAAPFIAMMRDSYDFLKNHPVNQKRIAMGKRPANAIWLWGEGTKPALDNFEELHGLKGSIISAVDLLKGIGGCAGMSVPTVEGVTGYLDTNFDGKCQKAIEEFKNGKDFVYVHVEAPDECGHRGEAENKVKAIELIDEKIVGPLMHYLDSTGEDYRFMCLPDHPTPLTTKTHARDPVPFAFFQKSEARVNGLESLNEETAKNTAVYIPNGMTLMKKFLGEIE